MAAKNHLFVSIPTHFRCPISMEVMKSPVSLSTGVTYDRSSIQAWLDAGHSTCPATMLPLSSPSFVPNLTLHRLIHLSSLSLSSTSNSLTSLVMNLKFHSNSDLYCTLKHVLDLANKSEENRRILANNVDFVDLIVGLMMKFDLVREKIENLEVLILISSSIVSQFDDTKEKIRRKMFNNGDSESNCVPKFAIVLRKGSVESKIAVAKVISEISDDEKTKRLMIETPNLLNDLHNLISNSDSIDAIDAGISAITTIAVSKSAKSEIVQLGGVRTAVTILCDAGAGDTVVQQKAMEMMRMMAKCGEGRKAICEDERCVVEIVRRLMKVSEKATEYGVTVLWSVCYRFPNKSGIERLAKSNGLPKCLLLLQSCCEGVVKEMCRDLVKVLRASDRGNCLGSYDTRTTHIMPY